MTITKSSLLNSVENRLDISRTEASEIVEAFLETIKKSLASGEDILISGFGKFCVKEKKGRKGRNPSTGEDLFLDARRVVTFKCSSVLNKRMNTYI
jgi:integration host factor subunit alpha